MKTLYQAAIAGSFVDKEILQEIVKSTENFKDFMERLFEHVYRNGFITRHMNQTDDKFSAIAELEGYRNTIESLFADSLYDIDFYFVYKIDYEKNGFMLQEGVYDIYYKNSPDFEKVYNMYK